MYKYGDSGEKLCQIPVMSIPYVDFFKNVRSQWRFKWARTWFLLESTLPEMNLMYLLLHQ